MQLNAVPSDWWYGKDRRKLEKSRFGDLWFGTGQCGGLFRIRVCFAILPLDASHTRQIALASLHNTVSSLASASWLGDGRVPRESCAVRLVESPIMENDRRQAGARLGGTGRLPPGCRRTPPTTDMRRPAWRWLRVHSGFQFHFALIWSSRRLNADSRKRTRGQRPRKLCVRLQIRPRLRPLSGLIVPQRSPNAKVAYVPVCVHSRAGSRAKCLIAASKKHSIRGLLMTLPGEVDRPSPRLQ